MSEKQEQLVTDKTDPLPAILVRILAAVVIFTLGYATGIDYGTETASTEWATEFVQGMYAGEQSYIGAENAEARKDVARAAQESGEVDNFNIEYNDIADGGHLIVTRTERNGVLYKELIRLEGGRLQGFSSMVEAED